MQFELLNTDARARRGRLVFERGTVETPTFMPVGTYGTVKAMTPEERVDVPERRMIVKVRDVVLSLVAMVSSEGDS